MSRKDEVDRRRKAMRDKLAARPGKAEMTERLAEKREQLAARPGTAGMQERLAEKREAARERLKNGKRKKKGKKEEKDNRRRWWLLLLILLLLFLMRDCRCTEEFPEVVPEPEPAAAPAAEPVELEPPLPTGTIKRRDRAEFIAMPPSQLPWIASFRMQVAARSPRLAVCFEGVNRPGRLKWTTSVEPQEGLVSEQELEPILMSDDLTSRQRGCVIEVLSDPPYQLEPDSDRSTPSRVGLVIEF